jgi:hypothetical protein
MTRELAVPACTSRPPAIGLVVISDFAACCWGDPAAEDRLDTVAGFARHGRYGVNQQRSTLKVVMAGEAGRTFNV